MVGDNLKSLYAKLPSAVKLVAVSKFHPVERLMEAYDAGQRVFGENRPQELAAKVPLMPSDVEWHFIGHLQTNKLKFVLPYATMVQSVDSFHLLEAIDKWGSANGKVIDILLELHLGAEETKHGFSEEEILTLVRKAGEGIPPAGVCLNSVRIRGLMGMATNTEDEVVIEADFARIESLFKRIRAEYPALAETFTELSIGMSGDWPLAVKHGATMVRIGTDIFGPREY
jgi:hypothetical protein